MSENVLSGLREVIEQGRKKMNVPGVTVAIVKDGELVWSEAFGLADMKNGISMTTDHILPIGSSSKAFTATAAVMLASEGKIDLDKPVRYYLPEFEIADPIASRESTPRDLLCHRTGMPRHDLMWIGWDDLDRRDLVANRLKHLPASKPFRSTWQYQNHMFATIGYLIERVSGRAWEDFIRERIFQPLGMTDASFRVGTDARYAKLYTEQDDVISENPPLVLDAIGPAGSINATAEQMAKWVLFNLNRGRVGDQALVDESTFAELHTPNIPYRLLPFEFREMVTLGYGLGWFIDLYRGHRTVGHGGNVNGASALVSMLPELNLGCVILTNADGTLLGYAIANEVYDRYLGCAGSRDWFDAYHSAIGEVRGPMLAKAKAIYDTKIPGKPTSHELSDYTGTYSHGGYGEAIVTLKDDQLVLQFHANRLALTHLHYDIFTFETMGMPFPVTFRTGVKGDIDSLCIPFEGLTAPIEFFRQEKEGTK